MIEFEKADKRTLSKLKAKEKEEIEACSAREPLNRHASVIPSTSKHVSNQEAAENEIVYCWYE